MHSRGIPAPSDFAIASVPVIKQNVGTLTRPPEGAYLCGTIIAEGTRTDSELRKSAPTLAWAT